MSVNNQDNTRTYGEFVGVSELYYAKVLQDTPDGYQADVPKFLAPTATISNDTKTSLNPTYYDNKPSQIYYGEGATDLTITVSGIPANVYAEITGKDYDTGTGRVLDTGEPLPPNMALSFVFNRGMQDERYYQYLKGTFMGGKEEATTKSDKVDVKTYVLTYSAVATTFKWNINGDVKSLKRIFGDTTDPMFDKSKWFDAVQTPAVI